jgi:uncharacterized membrane protein
MATTVILLGVFVIYSLYRFQEVEQALAVLRQRVDSLSGATTARPPAFQHAPPMPAAPGSPAPFAGAFDAPVVHTQSSVAPMPPPKAAAAPHQAAKTGHVNSSPPAPRVPPPVIAPAVPPPAAASGPRSAAMGDFESRVGGSWMARLGVIAIAFGMAFLLQYAFPLIGPAGRVGIGVAVGAALLGAGQALIRRPLYRLYAQALSSGGIIVLFLSIYAAHNLYHLIGYWTAFAALAVPALTASVLAVRNDTEAVAIFCVLGGFAVPVVLQTGQGDPDPAGLFRLYSYLGFLDLWVIGMALVKRWSGLPVAALAATWVLFFMAGSLHATGWTVEAFCLLFLVFSVVMGLQNLSRPKGDSGTQEMDGMLGVWIIGLGAAAFTFASEEILSRESVSGWPAISLAGILLTLLFAALSAVAPVPTGEKGQSQAAPVSPRTVFAYLSAGSALLVMWPAAGSVGTIPRAAHTAACGFALAVYLLFLGLAIWMARREQKSEAASVAGAFLLAGNAVVHVAMASLALKGVTVLGVPALAAWMPVAGWLSLVSLAAVNAGRGGDKSPVFAGTATICALAMIAAGLCLPAWGSTSVNGAGTALFAGELLLLSLTALGLRRVLIAGAFRADLLAAYGNAALFFLLLSSTLGMSKVSGITLLATMAAGFALYHGLVGAVLMRLPDPDKLHALTYFGLAVTFAALAVPLQLRESHVTTMAWAVEAVMLFWIGLAAREPRSRWYGSALLGLAAGKALLFDLQLDMVGSGRLPVSRLLACGSVVVACYVSTWMLGRRRELLTKAEEPVLPGLAVAANVVTLLCGSVHLWDAARYIWPAGGVSAPQLTLSIFWALYALAAIGVGIWKRLREVRLLAMGLLYLSILKVFLLDLAGLQQPYRIFSFLTLGVVLLLVSLLYTRFEAWLRETEGSGGGSAVTA